MPLSTVQTQGNIKHESVFSPYDEVESIVRGFFLLLWIENINTLQTAPTLQLQVL